MMDVITPLYRTPSTTPNLQPKVDEAYGILAMHASMLDKPTTLHALFSGGKDSIITTHLAAHLPEFRGVGHVRTDTGPAADRHSDRSVEIADKFGWKLTERSPTDTLPGIVAQYGFPGPGIHTWMYNRLKERAIRKITSDVRKKGWRIVYATGIRQAESAARNKIEDSLTVVTGSEWWVNPILSWSDDDVFEYINHHGLQVPSIGHSLDCFCGSYATPEEREWLQIEHPDEYEYILLLEDIARSSRQIQLLQVKSGHREKAFPEQYCRWGHGMNSNDVLRSQCSTKTNLCVNCDGKAYRASDPTEEQ